MNFMVLKNFLERELGQRSPGKEQKMSPSIFNREWGKAMAGEIMASTSF